MRNRNAFAITLVAAGMLWSSAAAENVVVEVSAAGAERQGGRLIVTVALPAGVAGKRIERAILEVPIALGGSVDDRYNDFPLMELYQEGSDVPKQTLLLAAGFSGIARFDVTRFVKSWSGDGSNQFVLGAVAESNRTVFALTSTTQWSSMTKARLIVEYSSRDGQSVSAGSE